MKITNDTKLEIKKQIVNRIQKLRAWVRVTRVTEKCVFVTMKANGKTKRYTWDDYLAAFDDLKLYFDGEKGETK